MADISKVFGDGKLSYDEFLIKAGELGLELGDLGEMRQSYEEKIRGIRCASALERELDRAAVKNRSLVTKIIDMNAVTVDEDGVSGIAEQLNALRESDPYLFETRERPADRGDAPATSRIRTGFTHGRESLDPDSMSDADYYKQIKRM